MCGSSRTEEMHTLKGYLHCPLNSHVDPSIRGRSKAEERGRRLNLFASPTDFTRRPKHTRQQRD
eukprot:1156962-Pelagomonas_calceolata.AAC.6